MYLFVIITIDVYIEYDSGVGSLGLIRLLID